jgi:hypothetical protein
MSSDNEHFIKFIKLIITLNLNLNQNNKSIQHQVSQTISK